MSPSLWIALGLAWIGSNGLVAAVVYFRPISPSKAAKALSRHHAKGLTLSAKRESLHDLLRHAVAR